VFCVVNYFLACERDERRRETRNSIEEPGVHNRPHNSISYHYPLSPGSVFIVKRENRKNKSQLELHGVLELGI
jgi:hypothetical protein